MIASSISPIPPNCALCGAVAKLRQSHIIPSFVFRWLKETSVTGYLRSGSNPRQRIQDGLKMPLLCASCEGMLNPWETAFATRIFHPYLADARLHVRYGDWMLKFCVSVSWRTLKFFTIKTDLEGWNDNQRAEAKAALERWRAFLFGEIPHPGPYEQHLLPVGEIESTSFQDLPKNMNRYLMRGVEIDAAHGEVSAFTYAKMGRFVLFGFVQPTSRRWEGTRIGVRAGEFRPAKFEIPNEIGDYLKNRARRHAELMDAIPDEHLDKITAKYMQDPGRAARTDEFAAVLHDERMFGAEAILRKPTKADGHK